MTLPNRIFHTLYHDYYLYEEAKRKHEEAEKNKGSSNSSNKKVRNPLNDMAGVSMEDIEDELEDTIAEG
jgi:hypothetical protein